MCQFYVHFRFKTMKSLRSRIVGPKVVSVPAIPVTAVVPTSIENQVVSASVVPVTKVVTKVVSIENQETDTSRGNPGQEQVMDRGEIGTHEVEEDIDMIEVRSKEEEEEDSPEKTKQMMKKKAEEEKKDTLVLSWN